MGNAITTEERSGVAVVRGFYAALERGDVPGMLELLDPQLKWRAPESVPWGGTFDGRKGFREFLGKLLAQPADFGREIVDWIDAGPRVVTLLRQRGRRKGADAGYDVAEVWVWTVRGGKIVDFEGYFDTATVLETLHLPPRTPGGNRRSEK